MSEEEEKTIEVFNTLAEGDTERLITSQEARIMLGLVKYYEHEAAIYKHLTEETQKDFDTYKEGKDINYLDGIHHKQLVEKSLGQIIEKPEECWFDIYECKLITDTFVFEGTYISESLGKEREEFLTLKDMAEFIEKQETISNLVIAESPLSGAIYRYDNYGKGEWQLIGTLIGYA